MQRHECKVGMKVYFGRENGEQTLAEIIKLNPTRAKVKTLETRGHGRGSMIGSIWNVCYSALVAAPTDAKAGETPIGQIFVAPPVPTEMKYNPFDRYNGLYECLASVYNQLEPESLTCDGEASRSQIAQRQRELHRMVKGLNYAIGREIDPMTIGNWYISKLDYERKQAAARKGVVDETIQEIEATLS